MSKISFETELELSRLKIIDDINAKAKLINTIFNYKLANLKSIVGIELINNAYAFDAKLHWRFTINKFKLRESTISNLIINS